MPVAGLNEAMVETDMQPTTVWPQADRLPRETSTAPPASALLEKRRLPGSDGGP
jgi:hypothetical protein